MMKSTSFKTIGIVGQGAIGLLAASQLALRQLPFHLLLRKVTNASLVLNFHTHQQDFPLLLNCQRPSTPIQLLLVPVKAFSVETALTQWLPYCAEDADIVLCHNGMGTIPGALQQLGPAHKLWFASTTHGALKTGPHRLAHTGHGSTTVGAVNMPAKQSTPPVRFLEIAMGPAKVVDDILPVLWQKLAINAVINPLTALMLVKNGELCKAEYRSQIRLLVDEFCQLAATQNQFFDPTSLLHIILKVAETTAGNYSSMHQDRVLQRPDELDFISGFLLKTAEAVGVNLPAHQQLYAQLRAVKPA